MSANLKRASATDPDPDIEAKRARLPKRKVALLLGYCGTGYHGMQLNPPHKTIEGDLFSALVKAGAVSPDNADDPKKSSLIRAARTDKGVHAAGNVVSLKMIIEDDDIVSKINANLPEQIRVWGFTRTNRAFECRKVCSSRVYEYVLPTYCLMNPRKSSALATAMERSNTSKPESSALSDEANKFWEGVDSDLKAKDITTFPEPSDESEGAEAIRKTVKTVENARRRSYRALPERIDALRKVLQEYEGVHNFHNFTVGKDFREASAKRVMKSLQVSDPFLVNGTEWVSIKIHGQSFMLHQIRKMIALAVLLVRAHAPVSKVAELFKQRKVAVPKAPALGLLLERPVYDGYNQRLSKLGRDEVTFEPYTAEIDAFKHRFIYDRIYTQEAAENEFHAFFGYVDTYRTPDLLNFILDLDSDVPEAEIAKEEDASSSDEEKATEENEG